MKKLFYLFCIIHLQDLSSQHVNQESLKGSWAVIGMKEKEKSTVIFHHDTTVEAVFRKQAIAFRYCLDCALDKNSMYSPLYLEYFTFGKNSFRNGFSTDSSYQKSIYSIKGKFKLADSTISMSQMLIKFKNEFIETPEVLFRIKMIDGLLVLTFVSTSDMLFLKRLEEGVIKD